MLEIFNKWYRRYLFEEESVLLLVLLTVAVVLLMTIGDILAPVLASIVLAYLAQGVSARLVGLGLPQWLGLLVSYLAFIGIFFGVSLGLLPLVWRQLLSLVSRSLSMFSLASGCSSALLLSPPSRVTWTSPSSEPTQRTPRSSGLGSIATTVVKFSAAVTSSVSPPLSVCSCHSSSLEVR